MPYQKNMGKPNGRRQPKRIEEATSFEVMQSHQSPAVAWEQKAEAATHSVGTSLKSWAETMREKGPRVGLMGNAASSLAHTMDCGGDYLEKSSLRDIGEDLTNLIRKNPFPALLVGLGLGFLVARATRRS